MINLSKNTKTGIIGAGTMGAGIAQVAATAGHQVVLYDSNTKTLENARNNLENILKRLVEKGKIDKQTSKNIFGRIEFADGIDAFKDCGLIIEAVVENLEVKQNLFRDIEKIASHDCILATNTSSLSIVSIASACEKPGRVLGIHFFNPPPLMPLV